MPIIKWPVPSWRRSFVWGGTIPLLRRTGYLCYRPAGYRLGYSAYRSPLPPSHLAPYTRSNCNYYEVAISAKIDFLDLTRMCMIGLSSRFSCLIIFNLKKNCFFGGSLYDFLHTVVNLYLSVPIPRSSGAVIDSLQELDNFLFKSY